MQDTYINYLKIIDSNLKRNNIDLELDFENRLDESIEMLNLFLYYNRIMLSTDSEYGVSNVLPFKQSNSAEDYIKAKLFEEYSDDWQKELNQLLEQPVNAGKLELDENLAKQFLNFLNISTEEQPRVSMQDIIKMASVEYDEPEYDTDEEEYDDADLYDTEDEYDPYEGSDTGVINNSEQEDDYDPYEDSEEDPQDLETIEQDNVSSFDAEKVGNSFESPYTEYDESDEYDTDESDEYDSEEDEYDTDEDEYDSDEDEYDSEEDEVDESDEYDTDESEEDESDEYDSEEDEIDDSEDEYDSDEDEYDTDEDEYDSDEDEYDSEEDEEDLFDDFDYDEEDNYDVSEEKLAKAQASVLGTGTSSGVLQKPAVQKPVAAIQTADAFVNKINKWLTKFR